MSAARPCQPVAAQVQAYLATLAVYVSTDVIRGDLRGAACYQRTFMMQLRVLDRAAEREALS